VEAFEFVGRRRAVPFWESQAAHFMGLATARNSIRNKKKRRFGRRLGEKINSRTVAQVRGFVKGEGEKRRNRIDRADMGRSGLRPYNIRVAAID
jgi:hypothetical protein